MAVRSPHCDGAQRRTPSRGDVIMLALFPEYLDSVCTKNEWGICREKTDYLCMCGSHVCIVLQVWVHARVLCYEPQWFEPVRER